MASLIMNTVISVPRTSATINMPILWLKWYMTTNESKYSYNTLHTDMPFKTCQGFVCICLNSPSNEEKLQYWQ